MTSRQSRIRAVPNLCFFVLGSLCFLRSAAAEKILAKNGDWEIYTDGRAAAFLSYVQGDGSPQTVFALDDPQPPPTTPPSPPTTHQVHDIRGGGGFEAEAQRQAVNGPIPNEMTQGTVQSMRVRSGLIGNTLGLGVRGLVGSLTYTGYIQIWAFVESQAREKNQPNPADVRQGYAKVEGWWGSILAGRSRALFSRGATDIDVLYGHRFGVGFPGNIDSNGPAAGHIGFGVLGSGFAAGFAYATPRLAGLQLTVGAYDPIQLQGAWPRTKWVRAESELTFERSIGQIGKIVLFQNGGYQGIYKMNSADSTYAGGIGYGGRLELGPARLGVAGHFGRGLGLNYALEVSDASLDLQGNLRNFDGYYVQTQLTLENVERLSAALRKIDISAGWGITRVFLNPADNVVDVNGNIPHSWIKHQMGISAGIVYHAKPWLHLDVDGFRAEAAWFLGEKQVLWVANSGMTFTW